MRAPALTKYQLLKPVLRRSIGTNLLLSVLGGAFLGLGAMSFFYD